MEQLYAHKTGYDARDVLESLPPGLSEALLDSIHRSTVVQVPLFRDLHEDTIKEICLALKQMRVVRGEFVYKEGTLARSMYLIEEGEVETSIGNHRCI